MVALVIVFWPRGDYKFLDSGRQSRKHLQELAVPLQSRKDIIILGPGHLYRVKLDMSSVITEVRQSLLPAGWEVVNESPLSVVFERDRGDERDFVVLQPVSQGAGSYIYVSDQATWFDHWTQRMFSQ